MTRISQAGGVTPDEIIEVLKNLQRETDPSLKYHQIENLRSRVQSPEHSSKLGEILGALKVPDSLGSGGLVRDPASGEPYPVTNNLIDDYIKELEAVKRMSNKSFNLCKYAQQGVAAKPKKKTRGNPFRVLMGKVGKLLDHGLQKREIVRYMLKEKIWNQETVEKAVGIVKDYNKKKHTRDKQVKAQTNNSTAEEWPRIEVDYAKRSSAELIASILWLNSMDTIDMTKYSFDYKEVEDRSGVKNMIRKIKSELLKRGMSEESLDLIMK